MLDVLFSLVKMDSLFQYELDRWQIQTILFSQVSKDENFNYANYVTNSMGNLHEIILEIEKRNNIYTI